MKSVVLDKDIVLLSYLPELEGLVYHGILDNKLYWFDWSEKTGRRHLVLLKNIIREEEFVLWNGYKDMIVNAVSLANMHVHGTYMLDLFFMEIYDGMRLFRADEFSQLIVNYSLKMSASQVCIIRYCSLYSVLLKCLEADWGKISFSCNVFSLKRGIEKLDLEIKKMISIAKIKDNYDSLHVFINDLSNESVLDVNNIIQTDRIKKMLRSIEKDCWDNLYIRILNKGNIFSIYPFEGSIVDK